MIFFDLQMEVSGIELTGKGSFIKACHTLERLRVPSIRSPDNYMLRYIPYNKINDVAQYLIKQDVTEKGTLISIPRSSYNNISKIIKPKRNRKESSKQRKFIGNILIILIFTIEICMIIKYSDKLKFR